MKKNIKLIISGLFILLIVISTVIYFKNNTYTVHLYSDGNLIKTIETRKNRTISTPEKPTKEGYIFIGWYTKDGEVFDFNKDITEDIQLYARWATIVLDDETEE